MAAAGAVALSVYAPALGPAVRYPGRPDGCLARLPRRAPRLRRRGGPRRGRLHGRGLRAAGGLMASLEVGIVGLPNSGKTSLFNALTESHAEITSYAAVQASANVGIAAVPDERIAALAQAVSAREQVPATVQFSDVAGLVRGSGTRDGGLGGEYLGHLRATHALAHVVRCLRRRGCLAPRRPHRSRCSTPRRSTSSCCSPTRCSSTRRRERTERAARVGEKSARDELGVLERLAAHLDEGLPARTLDVEVPEGPRPADHQARDLRRERLRGRRARARRGADRLRDRARRRGGRRRGALRGRAGRARGSRRPRRVPGRPRTRRAGHAAPGARLLPHARPDHVLHRRPDGGARLAGARGRDRPSRRRARSTPTSRAASSAPRSSAGTTWSPAGSHTEAQKRGVQRVEGKDYVVVDGDVLNIRFNV